MQGGTWWSGSPIAWKKTNLLPPYFINYIDHEFSVVEDLDCPAWHVDTLAVMM